MAGRISALRVQKHTTDRVNVYLDERFAFGLPLVYAAGLRVGQQLSDDEIARLQETDLLERTYERAVRFLGYRPRSEDEVRRHLAKKGAEQAVVDVVIERLHERRYLDDAEFARFWVENRQRFRPKGVRALRHELRLKGVAPEVIEDAVSGIEAGSLAYQAAQPQAARQAALAQSDPQAFRRRLTAYLLRRGFDYPDARDAIDRLVRELGVESSWDADDSTLD